MVLAASEQQGAQLPQRGDAVRPCWVHVAVHVSVHVSAGGSTSRPSWSHAAAHGGASAAPSPVDSSKRHVASLAASTATGSKGHVALPSSNVGYKLLRKAGWKEGSGLGAQEQGSIEPVQALVKKDKQGDRGTRGRRPRVVGRPGSAVLHGAESEPGVREEGGRGGGGGAGRARGKAKKRRREGGRKGQRQRRRSAASKKCSAPFSLEFLPDNV